MSSSSSSSELDEALEASLIAASPYNSLDQYKLPSSTDVAAIPQDPNNRLTAEKVALGRFLFHGTALMLSPRDMDRGLQTGSCAACHHPGAGFQAGAAQGIGEGGWGFGGNGFDRVANPDYEVSNIDILPIRSPSAMNGGYQKNNL